MNQAKTSQKDGWATTHWKQLDYKFSDFDTAHVHMDGISIAYTTLFKQ